MFQERIQMGKPVWFLDVDGVINAVSKIENVHYSQFSTWEETVVNGYKIRYSPEVVDFINKMSERVEVRWLTTWRDKAVEMLAPALGINVFPYDNAEGRWNPNGSFGGQNYLPENRWWKLNVILNHIENGGEHFIWSDDDLNPYVRNYVRKIADVEGMETVFITPEMKYGLTGQNLERIEKFVSNMEKYYPDGINSGYGEETA
jgi:hypothetical protein